MLELMQSPTKTKLSMEKVLRAEAELLAYVQSGSGDPQHQKQLAKAVQFAIDESTGPVPKPSPTRWEFSPASRPTNHKDTTRLRLTPSSKPISSKSQPSRNRVCRYRRPPRSR
jgi:hypothetical protein